MYGINHNRLWREPMRRFLALLALAVPIVGCAAKTDLTQLGAGVGATWNDGPKLGVDASAGKHEVTVAPLFPQAGSAAEGASGEACPGGVCPVPAPASPAGKFCPN